MKEIPENLEQLMQPGWRALAEIIINSLTEEEKNGKGVPASHNE